MKFVTKRFTFEAAHRLIRGYPGRCQNVHGHSYFVEVTLGRVESSGLDRFGFVKDFSEFKILKKWIDDNLDHASIVSKEDKSWLKWIKKEGQRHFIVDGNPTSEIIALYIFSTAMRLLEDSDVYVSNVRVQETRDSWMDYSRG